MTDVGYLTLADLNADIDKYISYKFLKNGVDVTDSYVPVFSKYGAVSSVYVPICIDPRPIELTAASDTKVYDGEPLSNTNVSITRGSLVDGHRLIAETNGSITEIGSKQNVISSVIIIDSRGEDVTGNYDINTKNGKLTILDDDEW